MNIEKWKKSNAESLSGKTIAVTGSTGGLGQALCAYLASLGASLVLLDRNPIRSAAHKAFLSERCGADVKCITLDLESLSSAEKAVSELTRIGIDIFIHNAGAYSIPRHKCESGYGNVFQINFATPYYMIKRLLPSLSERKGRVIAVGSIAHNYSRIDEKDIDFETRKAASKVYGNAKRYLMYSLFELFKDETEASLSIVHPGIAFTNITAHYPKLIFAVIKNPMKVIFMKPRKAALSILRGVFENTAYCEWIGPRWFDVWGFPKKKALKTADADERTTIYRIAEEVY
ncbi:MAG: SDR family NAD(P)-dependent oxidoreductase, partial [Clostridia bacterium]|nr:SDR family NAD(P)-dependent oxidoreductase [Clostridia bacterium]